MFWFPYLFLLAVMIFASALYFFGVDADTLFVAIITLAGVVLTLHHAQKARIKEDTIKVALETETSEFFQKQYSTVEYDFLRKNRKTGKVLDEYNKLSKSGDKAKQKIVEAVGGVLNFFEFLSYGVRKGLFDKDIAANNFRSMLCGLVYDLRDIIAEARKENPRTYEHLVALYLEWADRNAIGVEWDENVEAKLTVST